MNSKPSSSIFWFFILAAALYVGSRGFFSQGSCTCLSGRCQPVPVATEPEREESVGEPQLTQKP